MLSLPSVDASDRQSLIAEWYASYKLSLAAYLLRLLGDSEQAADALHDTFLRAFVALKPQTPPENPFAWLYRIATNVAYSQLRRHRRQRLRWLALSGREHGPDLESQVVQLDLLRRCLARLGRKEAEALLLYEHAGLSCTEISELTGETPGAVRVRIFRARERFRRLYEKGR